MPKLGKKKSAKKRRPYIFVNQVDIRPRQKQFPSVYEPVLVVSHLSISVEEVIEKNTSSTQPLKPKNYFISHAYNKANLAKTAIQYFLQTTIVHTYRIPALDTNKLSAQNNADDVLPMPDISKYNYIEETSSSEPVSRRSNIFRKIRYRLIAILLDQLQR